MTDERPHCRWCACEDWVFTNTTNVGVALVTVLAGVLTLAALLFTLCVLGATLAGV